MSAKFGILVSLSLITFVACSSLDIRRHTFNVEKTEFGSVRIPFEFDSYGFTPTVDVIFGDKKLKLAIDTGFDRGVFSLNSSVLNRMDISNTGSRNIYNGVQGKTYSGSEFIVPSVTIGGMKLTDVWCSEETRNFESFDGLVGNGFLKKFLVLIDYSTKELVLYEKGGYPIDLHLETWERIPFTHNSIGIIVPGKLSEDGEELRLCLDTGTSVNHRGKTMGILRSKHASSLPIVGRLRLAQLSASELPYAESEHLFLNGNDLGATHFLLWDFKQPPIDGFLGHNLFINYRVFIDFDAQVLFLKKQP